MSGGEPHSFLWWCGTAGGLAVLALGLAQLGRRLLDVIDSAFGQAADRSLGSSRGVWPPDDVQ